MSTEGPVVTSYLFHSVTHCNMCYSGNEDHVVIGRRLNKKQGLKPGSKSGIAIAVTKCKNCSLIFANPLPLPFDIQHHYNISPQSYWKDEYFEEDASYFSNEIRVLSQLLTATQGMTALDIGAGLGKAMRALSTAGYDCYGIEPSKSFFDTTISRTGISENRLFQVGVEEAAFEPEFFDFITFGAVLEHLPDPSSSIKKAMNWLKPNGIIHIEVPSSNWLISRVLNSYYKATFSDFVVNISPMHPPFHLYEFGLESFIKNGRLNGYEVAFYEYFVCDTYMPRIFDFFLKSYMKLTNTGMQLSIWLKKSGST